MNDLTSPNVEATSRSSQHFNFTARVLHGSMALAILTMLFVGIGMVASLSLRPTLVSLHRPLGIVILLLVIVRLLNRLRHRPPRCRQTCRARRCSPRRHFTGCFTR